MSSISERLEKFLASPKNQTGLILLGSTIPGYIAQLESHNTSLAVAAGALFAGFLHIIVPDNTALISAAPKLLTDTLAAADEKKPSEIPEILSDATQVAADIAPATPTALKG